MRWRSIIALALLLVPRLALGADHVAVVLENNLGKLLKVHKATFTLDDAAVLQVGDGDARLSPTQVTILDRELSPGVHTLVAELGVKGRDVAVFDYMRDYRFSLRVRVPFVVEAGKTTQIALTLFLREGESLRFEERPSATYLIARSLSGGRADRDGDRVADDADGCPDIKGPTITNGCPDQDGDLIPDKNDKCPTERETINGYQDEDGCPDTAPAASAPTSPTAGEIAQAPEPAPVAPAPSEAVETKLLNPTAITSKVYHFGFSADRLQASDHQALDRVARALLDHPEIRRIRIEGHCDYLGSATFNQDLSERRARSVAEYLVGKSIDRARLDPAGFGASQPVDPGRDATARAQNRRVELRIVE